MTKRGPFFVRQLYYLIIHEFQLIRFQVLIICLASLLGSQILFAVAVPAKRYDEELLFTPFEQLVDQSGQGVLFLLTLIAVLVAVGLALHQQFVSGKSIYRFYQLESGAGRLYAAKLIAGLTGVLLVVLTELVAVLLGWAMVYQGAVDVIHPGSLQLAFLRSVLLQRMLPGALWLRLLQFLALVLAVCLPLTAVLELHKPGKSAAGGLGALLVVALAGLALLAPVYASLDEIGVSLRVILILAMAAQVGVTCWRGWFLMRRRIAC